MRALRFLVAFAAVMIGWATTPLPSMSGACAQWRLVSKSCSNCGRSVSLSSRAGDRCPHCGAIWGSEQQRFNGGPPAACSRPIVPAMPRVTGPGDNLDYGAMTAQQRKAAKGILANLARLERLNKQGTREWRQVTEALQKLPHKGDQARSASR
jgi:hypothetical protein